MARQAIRDTTPERQLRAILHARGRRYFVHRRPVPSLRREADLVFPGARVAVFVDGCFWHSCPDHGTAPIRNDSFWADKLIGNRNRDADTDLRLAEAGWLSIRVWEHEDPSAAADRIEAVLIDGHGLR